MTDPPPADSLGDLRTVTGDGPPAADAAAVAPPGFAVERELGRGGMGVVYLARQAGLNRPVALKLVLGSHPAESKALIRFLAEAEAVAAVRHPNVVEVYQYGEHAGRPFLAMEYCPGGSLDDLLKASPDRLDPRRAAEVLAGVAAGVAAAHAQGIVHRDLKPGNVLLASGGREPPDSTSESGGSRPPLASIPKVTDFGLAKRAAGETELTRTNAVMGTPAYMAPEQAQGGAKFVGPAADVWALGVMLYELLTGGRPFRGDDTFSLLAAVMKGEVERPRKRVPGVPRDLELICLKCLEMDPGRRYPTAAELAADLRAYLDGRPIAARPPSAGEQAWRWVRRHPAAGATAGVVCAAVGTVVGVLGWKNAQLEAERDAAQSARAAAQGRLEVAVGAVERMLVRTAGEGWARNPAVQPERRAVLEEAIGFFRGLSADDSADPLVRTRRAAAEYRIGLAHMSLADYDRAAAAFDAAAATQEGLLADAPADPDRAAELARTLGHRGHVHLIRAEFAPAQQQYERMAELTRQAAAARPDHEPFRVARVEALTYLGSFRTYAPGPAGGGRGLFDEALAEARELAARPAPSYRARLYLAVALLNQGGQWAGLGPARAVLAEVEPLLAGLGGEKPPSAQDADTFDLCRSRALLLRGVVRTAGGDRGGVADFDAGLAAVELVLASQPRMFPALNQKFNLLARKTEALHRLGLPAEARAAGAATVAHAEGMARDDPKLGWMRFRVAGLRADALARRARAGDAAGLDAEAADLLAPAPDPGTRYNVACALSLGSRHGTPAEREARAAKAVALLTALLDGDYYRGPTNAAHVDKDADLDPVRDRADFRAFRQKLAALPPKAP